MVYQYRWIVCQLTSSRYINTVHTSIVSVKIIANIEQETAIQFFVNMYIYQHLQRGANWTLRESELTPFRNHLAPLWRCWSWCIYIYIIYMYIHINMYQCTDIYRHELHLQIARNQHINIYIYIVYIYINITADIATVKYLLLRVFVVAFHWCFFFGFNRSQLLKLELMAGFTKNSSLV